MSTATIHRRFTLEQYFERESSSELKHEFWDGEIVAMSGVSPEHDRIAGEIRRLLGNHLVGKPCEVFSSDVRVKVSATSNYAYPDVTISCNAKFETIQGLKTIVNPVAVFEVLSPSTEINDRGKKLGQYIHIESLVEYLIVSQYEMRVDHIVRRPDGLKLAVLTLPDDVLHLESIDFGLKLSEIYSRVEFTSRHEESPS